MTMSVTTRIGGACPVSTKRIIAAAILYAGLAAMTIRAKLYAAIVLTILGPLATTAVALHGMSQMGDRFDEVRERAEHEAIARELKFLVTDVNGWQTAYGYARRRPPRPVRAPRRRSSASELDSRGRHAHRRSASGELLERARAEFDSFMELDAVAWRSAPGGRPGPHETILLGPELRALRGDGRDRRASSPTTRPTQATATEAAFDDARDDARRRLIAVALGAGGRGHPAAGHRQRHRPHGARGRAPRAGAERSSEDRSSDQPS